MSEELKKEMIEILRDIAMGMHENDEMRICADFLEANNIEIEDSDIPPEDLEIEDIASKRLKNDDGSRVSMAEMKSHIAKWMI